MGSHGKQINLPSSDSTDLHLSHPTQDECIKIWTNTSDSWKDSLELPDYLRESQFLTPVPLAKDGGMTTWILVDKNLPPNQHPILCSCETFYKRSLMSDASGNAEEVQSGHKMVASSILYSDIGKGYYAKLGWTPNPTNTHFQFTPLKIPKSGLIRDITETDLPELCRRDEVMIRKAMTIPVPRVGNRFTILPDLDHMLWHIRKEDFATEHLFGKMAQVRGAIAGPPGKQVWAIWTRRYYGCHDVEGSDNVLYILRLVVGDISTNMPPLPELAETGMSLSDEQVMYLEAVLQAARDEAAEWRLDHVRLWEPSPLVEKAIVEGKLDYIKVEREEESIASCMWYDEHGNPGPLPTWINNQHYAWC
ncbi:hypothetical protein F4806DRAFT_497855 [Annulohypoxylon nitens]|nr:hypothetical protein F4806DRAFT_497855 [Annulohypoxylon nitens]